MRNELLKFHGEWYSSNIMAMAVLGQQVSIASTLLLKKLIFSPSYLSTRSNGDFQDLETLEQMAVERVSAVLNKEVPSEWVGGG